MSDPIELTVAGRVAVLTLGGPGGLILLGQDMARCLIDAVAGLDARDDIGCVVITGRGRVFAAGADIREMQAMAPARMARQDYFSDWDRLTSLGIPKIAAVNGLALGGGCELAMMCDILISAQSATFAQPEINLGVMPGMGGTQRLVRLIGRARAMEMILTGRRIDSAEALRIGLLSAVVPDEELAAAALAMATTIAGFSSPAVRAAREAVNRADETTLKEGILFERRQFHALFASEDRVEGMAAFLERRPAIFRHR